jgi:hypothetical protein
MERLSGDQVVEFHAGYKGEETPRAVLFEGRRIEVASVILRKRIVDSRSGLRREVWRCRLDDGREVTIELAEDGSCSVLPAA